MVESTEKPLSGQWKPVRLNSMYYVWAFLRPEASPVLFTI